MATKKQKREAALAKREKFMAEQKALGLEAQRQDRHNREMEAQADRAYANQLNAEHRATILRQLLVHGQGFN